ncbi:MAG: isocitrate dehydrogenase kinase/phosphatase AceK regulatory subunit [Caldilinea sp.]
MSVEPIKRNLARNAAAAIHSAFDDYHNEFKAITRRARERFERREWAQWQDDAIARLGLREEMVQRVVAGLRVMMGEQVHSTYVWTAIKEAYARLINQRKDVELAETFYNSVMRCILATVGVEPAREFVW